jgi:spoIIIJ-associated protein
VTVGATAPGHSAAEKRDISMEWVETTAKTIEAAREAALDQLGVGADEAEFDVIEEPRPGLFGRMRGEARLRARVRPTQARPKQERRRKGKSDKPDKADKGDKASDAGRTADAATSQDAASDDMASTEPASEAAVSEGTSSPSRTPSRSRRAPSTASTTQQRSKQNEDNTMTNDERPESTVTPDEVGAAAVAFMDGLTTAFGVDGTSSLQVDELELRVDVTGSELGLLVGPGGRTLNAIQDLARVSAQRRLGDHDTRLRIDVAGYRERREAALASFARDVADQVRTTGTARSLEPMSSSDRKVVHDVLNDEDGVSSRSVGEDPDRRIIVEPA